MIYRKFQDHRIAALGFGCMRLPLSGSAESDIDVEQTQKMVAYAMDHGINYFDTAWGYHNGNSETVIGRTLSHYPREDYYLATKFPGYDLENMPKVAEIFERQLEKCGVDYFDFYLFHNVCEMNIDAYLDEKYGIMDYLRKQKAGGRIRHLGFSTHGSCEVIRRFLDAYGSEMEFCQIQLNYVDWHFQNAEDTVRLLKEYDLPIWVMEPLRGGRLAALDDDNAARLSAMRPDETDPAWAFRFLQSVPEVTVVLSGMSGMEQLEANVRTFEEERPLSAAEQTELLKIADDMIREVPCTACHYCTSHCPKGLDIPALIKLYNEHVFTGGNIHISMALNALPTEKRPEACIGCHSCEKVCPQQIRVSEILADFTARMKE